MLFVDPVTGEGGLGFVKKGLDGEINTTACHCPFHIQLVIMPKINEEE